ncbi:RNA-binding cell elongation regulator Jag/EloR [Paenibacillus methanolicus]|uniref:RNA-binding protein KhpB n=1 Tax=Paenibacillus methanolicus TaxID=582686 RepID=A0A5S5CAH5_9BACL|nr:RNA-binding cell elongation regulator Jag/EloR [Paenibacillus methanolicus]TYP75340.1 spoIIIJ-associated protein [Paenibacillus methanolicus]
MRKIVASGKTIDDAVRNGLTELNTTMDQVAVTVLEAPSRGLFGLIGVKPAKVEIALIEREVSPAAAEASPEGIEPDHGDVDPLDEAERFIVDVGATMGLSLSVTRSKSREGTTLAIQGSGDLGLLIGRRGQTLDAMQYLVNIVANRYSDSHLRIVLDAENFRDRRRKTLEDLSDRLAGRVIRTKKEVMLEPMSPQDRKVIHAQLQNHARVKTYSKGDEPNRCVVITLKQDA